MTKRLTAKDSAFTLLFWMTFLQAIWSTIIALPTLRLPGLEPAAWVLAMTVIGLVAHFALSRAFAFADAIVVAPLDFLRLPASAVVGWALYGEALSVAVAVGALIVVIANALNIWGERRRLR
jgi:drug/metabolite transporter (DMT)-like permease